MGHVRMGHPAFFKVLVEPRNVGIVNIGILYTVNRGWRDANRTAAGTAALHRRFPSGKAAIDFAAATARLKPRPTRNWSRGGV